MKACKNHSFALIVLLSLVAFTTSSSKYLMMTEDKSTNSTFIKLFDSQDFTFTNTISVNEQVSYSANFTQLGSKLFFLTKSKFYLRDVSVPSYSKSIMNYYECTQFCPWDSSSVILFCNGDIYQYWPESSKYNLLLKASTPRYMQKVDSNILAIFGYSEAYTVNITSRTVVNKVSVYNSCPGDTYTLNYYSLPKTKKTIIQCYSDKSYKLFVLDIIKMSLVVDLGDSFKVINDIKNTDENTIMLRSGSYLYLIDLTKTTPQNSVKSFTKYIDMDMFGDHFVATVMPDDKSSLLYLYTKNLLDFTLKEDLGCRFFRLDDKLIGITDCGANPKKINFYDSSFGSVVNHWEFNENEKILKFVSYEEPSALNFLQ